MERKEELIELIKVLLGKVEDASEDQRYMEVETVEDHSDLIKAALKVSKITKQLDKYLAEYKEL